jgi:hypothetical protein
VPFALLWLEKWHHEAHEGRKDFVEFFNFFVNFVSFVVAYSSDLVAALPRCVLCG